MTLRRRRILFAGFVARMGDPRLPKSVVLIELVGVAGCVGAQEKEWMGCFLDDLGAFGISTTTSGRLQPRTRGNAAERSNRGGKFHSKIDRCRAWAGLRYTVLCPNVTGRTKERIAQSTRARAGLLAAVD